MNKANNSASLSLVWISLSILLSTCFGNNGNYATSSTGLPQLACGAQITTAANGEISSEGNLNITPGLVLPKAQDNVILYDYTGGYGLSLTYLVQSAESTQLYFYASSSSTIPYNYPGTCAADTIYQSGPINAYDGGTLIFKDCKALISNGIMNFSASYVLYKQSESSSGIGTQSGTISFSCPLAGSVLKQVKY